MPTKIIPSMDHATATAICAALLIIGVVGTVAMDQLPSRRSAQSQARLDHRQAPPVSQWLLNGG